MSAKFNEEKRQQRIKDTVEVIKKGVIQQAQMLLFGKEYYVYQVNENELLDEKTVNDILRILKEIFVSCSVKFCNIKKCFIKCDNQKGFIYECLAENETNPQQIKGFIVDWS